MRGGVGSLNGHGKSSTIGSRSVAVTETFGRSQGQASTLIAMAHGCASFELQGTWLQRGSLRPACSAWDGVGCDGADFRVTALLLPPGGASPGLSPPPRFSRWCESSGKFRCAGLRVRCALDWTRVRGLWNSYFITISFTLSLSIYILYTSTC
jgi:hypothetical protein